jgi:hypothetical protein
MASKRRQSPTVPVNPVRHHSSRCRVTTKQQPYRQKPHYGSAERPCFQCDGVADGSGASNHGPSIISQSAPPAAAGACQYRTHPEDEQKQVAFERTKVRLLTFHIRRGAHDHDLNAYVGSATLPKPRGTFRQSRRSRVDNLYGFNRAITSA